MTRGLISEDAVREHLRRQVARAPTQLAWSVAHGVSDSLVSRVLRGQARPGPKILRILGLRRVVAYEPAASAPEPADA